MRSRSNYRHWKLVAATTVSIISCSALLYREGLWAAVYFGVLALPVYNILFCMEMTSEILDREIETLEKKLTGQIRARS